MWKWSIRAPQVIFLRTFRTHTVCILTWYFPEHCVAHELLETICIEARSMDWHCVLKQWNINSVIRTWQTLPRSSLNEIKTVLFLNASLLTQLDVVINLDLLLRSNYFFWLFTLSFKCCKYLTRVRQKTISMLLYKLTWMQMKYVFIHKLMCGGSQRIVSRW